ncbi:MAG: hypothetical protein LBR26_13345 [Prevotella sp.]|nr:hypothetical protein [Prevotella sp.]
MPDKESRNSPRPPVDPLELISRAGKLNYSIDQTAAIVCSFFPAQNAENLRKLLTDPASKEYNAYLTGKDIRLFEVENALYDAAVSGDVDAPEKLFKLQTDKIVSREIKRKFFPDQNNTECD